MSKRASLAFGSAGLAVAGLLVSGLAGAQTPPAQPARQRPPALGIAGTQFTVDDVPRFLVVVSYFDALRASDKTLEADFTWLRRHGIDGVRIFPNWWKCEAVRQCGGHAGDDALMAPDGRLRPAILARLQAVLSSAGRHGLVVDVSFARETVRDAKGVELSPAPYADALVAAVTAIGEAPHVMVDLQNEVYQNRVFAEEAAEDAPKVAALAKRVDASDRRIVFVSTNSPEAERYTYCGVDGPCPRDRVPLDVIAVHDAREPNWHDLTPAVVRDLLALGQRRGPRPVYLQEPQPWQDERAPDRLERFLDAAARARRAGAAAWTFHTRAGFILRDGRSMQAQMDADERRFIEQVRARVDASAAARRRP
jgi:hypothetical protein